MMLVLLVAASVVITWSADLTVGRSTVGRSTRILVPRSRALAPPEQPSKYWPALRQVFQAEAEQRLAESDNSLFNRGSDTLVDLVDAAGYSLLTPLDERRCQALNAGYLRRLSLETRLVGLDPDLAEEIGIDPDLATRLLYDGRLLVFHRGYGCESLSGKLTFEKLNFWQSAIGTPPS